MVFPKHSTVKRTKRNNTAARYNMLLFLSFMFVYDIDIVSGFPDQSNVSKNDKSSKTKSGE